MNNRVREAVKRVYPSKQWHDQVENMKPSVVAATYMRLHRQGKLKEKM